MDEYSNSSITQDNLWENVTNHWLYFVFSGYVLPLVSPRLEIG